LASFSEVGDPAVLLAVIAEGPGGSGFRLEFQRATVFDEQDHRLGMDTYCISTSEGPTHYGGVIGIHIDGGDVDIDLDAVAADRLHLPERFRLCLDVPEVDKAAFIAGLKRVLAQRPSAEEGSHRPN
jgi:hypothetical protein